jgi:hypothetical protein
LLHCYFFKTYRRLGAAGESRNGGKESSKDKGLHISNYSTAVKKEIIIRVRILAAFVNQYDLFIVKEMKATMEE